MPDPTDVDSTNQPRLKDDLPPVEPPSAGFLVQLFVVPLVIVVIIVLVWMMFSWLAHMGSSPQELVRDLKRPNEASWQRALTLADLLRNQEYDQLKRDPDMARELAGILNAQLDDASTDSETVKLRIFLCRALGELRVPEEVLPVLLRAATQERDPVDLDVRRTALEALAIFVTKDLQSNEELMQTLLRASRERSDRNDEKLPRAELRSAAAFVLGVLGGPESLDRLELLMDDAYANTRYNAAVGLARHGDIRSERVLLEMLDPNNQASAQTEEHEAGKASKRLLVIKNGISATKQLAERNAAHDLSNLTRALEAILESDLKLFNPRVRRGIRINTEEALISLRGRKA